MASEEEVSTRPHLLKRGDIGGEIDPPKTKISNLTRHLMNTSAPTGGTSNSSFPNYIDSQEQLHRLLELLQMPQLLQPQLQLFLPLTLPLQMQNKGSSLIPTSHGQYLLFSGYGSFQGSTNNRSNNSNSNFDSSSSFYRTSSSFQQPVLVPVGTLDYIPSTHNTPTVVTLLYSSNHLFLLSHLPVPHYKPANLTQGVPTTTILMELASPVPSTYHNPQRYPLSYPQNDFHYQQHNQNQNQFQNQNQEFNPYYQMKRQDSSGKHLFQNQKLQQQDQIQNDREDDLQPDDESMQTFESEQGYFDYHAEPDHYMTYKEFLENLNNKEIEAARASGSQVPPEQHLNITEYPINDLILMLSCLLTKIVEANDKLHPNHFDNTIATRQKQKEEKRLRKLQKQKIKREEGLNGTEMGEYSHENETFTEDWESNDEEDEMKNKYLANVLAFHGKNIPGISLHAYLTRVLKYCPVTSDVFLSLLVYFDRIAKKANNLKKQKKERGRNSTPINQEVTSNNKNNNLDDSNTIINNDNNNDNNDESNGTGAGAIHDETDIEDGSEQLFVMDSYNIHRLIILGITVSSKFFLDIFYKNLRYAKVGGLPLEELNYLELQFLLLLDFKLMISVEDLQNYGDLLLRFWKREQVTNELVNGANYVTQDSSIQTST